MRKLTTEKFIDKARQVHDDKYDYSKVVYKTAHIKVKIICTVHGVFEQTPNKHLSGSGCPGCGGNKKFTTEEFIDKAKQVHGDKYDYSQVVYKGTHIKIKIICPIHREFEQRPNGHLKGKGCPGCGGKKKLTAEKFIDKARQVHGDKYDYSKVVYKHSQTKVKIICLIHGEFEQSPNNHLKGKGCPGCGGSKKLTTEELISLLTIEEDPKEENGEIYCRCAKCKEYFIPTRDYLHRRIYSLLGKGAGECRLYCSDECKDSCSIFGQVSYPKGHLPNTDTSRPDQRELRLMTLERDNYQCQKCGSTEDLVCHHFTGVEVNPIESADVDNCITYCYNCHQRVHSEKGCNMRREKCQ